MGQHRPRCSRQRPPVVQRGRLMRGAAPADETRPIRLVAARASSVAGRQHHAEHPRRPLLRRARTARHQDGAVVRQQLRCTNRLLNARCSSSVTPGCQHHLRVTSDHRDRTRPDRLVSLIRRISTSSSVETAISVCVSTCSSCRRNSARPGVKTASYCRPARSVGWNEFDQ